jgi:mRNA interferase RelE/StbE
MWRSDSRKRDVAEYRIVFARSARRELEGLPAQMAERILQKIRPLAQAPRPPGSKKLQGSSRLWRIRVGDYRVVYEIFDDTTTVK